ncbi:Cyclin-dependent kinase regulatory subunit family protein [Babesia bovis T2Bo]|uniref:Cyclin-dependent kinases regulatory subunit n=1 Tax=Babesia bovis TaxID=5865 RepID=A7ARD7_BABBO|nr:Cyclin-dependent kinase regulatory subunit family protein [Babesia bovis T2Bo]EDO07106.1 Cyclin-dependent kinase regulatory subunit family protein [Babesia bovis T2Bo]|eukprot:XP_001610674.1 hypothetical protein [Babesia bovis T2Bo]
MDPKNQTRGVLTAARREQQIHIAETLPADDDGLLAGLKKHKVDTENDSLGLHCNPLFKNGNKRVVIKSDSLKSDWLGLWKVPVNNPFNMYGTIPSRMKTRDKRKTYSVPPLVDIVSDTKLEECLRRSMQTKLSPETQMNVGSGTNNMNLDSTESRLSNVQRINTILSESRSLKSALSISTARSTVDSLRYSESFEDMIPEAVGPTPTEMRLTTLLNNLYLTTRNGFLSGALPENPGKDKHHVDADFIAVSLARKAGSNPGLILFHELESIVSAPTRYRSYRDSYSSKKWDQTDYSIKSDNEVLVDNAVRKQRRDSQKSIKKSPTNQTQEFVFTEERDLLLWNASTDIARETMKRSGIAPRPVTYDLNDDFMVTDADDYAVLQTRFGKIIYSPKFKDDKYMYRFVLLTKEAQEAVEALSRTLPNASRHQGNYITSHGPKRYLTEFEIVRQLGIQMSPGWEHFMYFKELNKELVLRKRL